MVHTHHILSEDGLKYTPAALTKVTLPPGDTGQHLGTSVVTVTGSAPSIEWKGARDAVQPPAVPRMAPQRMIQLQRQQC